MRGVFVTLIVLALSGGTSMAASVSLQISGPGAVDQTTIKAGQPVSVDIYFTNDDVRHGITVGFEITSPDLTEVVHPADSGQGLNKRGDVKGYNGWEGNEVWDLFGIFVVENDWNGHLPDTIGFGAVCNAKTYGPHELEKKLSFGIVVPESGTLVIDSSYFPPSGKWLYSSRPGTVPSHQPQWGGPYTYKVIE